MNPLQSAIGAALGVTVAAQRPLSGGDINDAYLVTLADGRRVFVKTHGAAPRGMFSAEAHGLSWLAEAGALELPQVLAVSDAAPAFLVLEYLEPAPAARDYDDRLGEGLANLHLASASAHGFDRDNFIGSLPQNNQPCRSWPEFWLRRRLKPQVRRAIDARKGSHWWPAALERLSARSGELLPDGVAHRLHGDLWAGNVHVGPGGRPWLIDPAAYAGHGEVDLAMMRLFGGFSERVFRAYEAVAPLEPRAQQRIELYQLYPLLVHVNLFGGGYVGSVDRILDRFGRH